MATATHSIREIVATQPSAASILVRFEIDLCANAWVPHPSDSLNVRWVGSINSPHQARF